MSKLILPALPPIAAEASTLLKMMHRRSHALSRFSIVAKLIAEKEPVSGIGRLAYEIEKVTQEILHCEEAVFFFLSEGGRVASRWERTEEKPVRPRPTEHEIKHELRRLFKLYSKGDPNARLQGRQDFLTSMSSRSKTMSYSEYMVSQ